ncbi:MAG: MATE family efflux transporter [Anaeroplasma sp.]
MVYDDLAKGNPYKVIIKLAIPAMFAQFINVLYSIIDRFFISSLKEVGDLALSGIGITAPICTFITSFSFLIGLGGAPLLAMCLGEKRYDNAKKILFNAFISLVFLGILVPLVIFLFHNPLLNLFGASNNTYFYAKEYLLFYLIGAPFALMTLGLNQYLISQGYSNKAMITMLLGAIINIILDPLFIYTLNLGVRGAAIATTISQFLSFCYVLFLLSSRFSQIRISKSKIDFNIIGKIFKLGFSPFIIAMTDSLIFLVMNMSIKLYSDNFDSYILIATITTSFYQIFSMPLLGISGGTNSILSFNYGAKNSKRVLKSERIIVMYALIYTAISFVLSLLISRLFVEQFTLDSFIIEETIKMIKIFMIGFIPLSFQYCYVDGLTALGMSKYAISLSLIRKISMIALTLLLPLLVGVIGCFLSEAISDILASIITFSVFSLNIKKILFLREKSQENVV